MQRTGVQILLIEDNENDVLLAREAFSQSGSTTHLKTARSSAQARELIRSQTPDLILLDLSLPGESGLALLRELRGAERTRHTPIVVCTGSNSTEDVQASYAAGANAFVTKPVQIERYFELFTSLDRFWSGFVEYPRGLAR